jgi:hypothetical protein
MRNLSLLSESRTDLYYYFNLSTPFEFTNPLPLITYQERLIPSLILLVVIGILCLATCYLVTTRSLLSVVTGT